MSKPNIPEPGTKFNDLEFIKYVGRNNHRKTIGAFACKCGATCECVISIVKSGVKKSCPRCTPRAERVRTSKGSTTKTGEKFGAFEFVQHTNNKNKFGSYTGIFRCQCGETFERAISEVRKQRNKHCRKCAIYRNRLAVNAGDKFGDLTLVSHSTTRNRQGLRVGIFLCACGETHQAPIVEVMRGRTTRCLKCATEQTPRNKPWDCQKLYPEGTKKCARCGEDKSPDQFKPRPGNGNSTRHSYCQQCRKERFLIEKYGITMEQYNTMLKSQNGACAICGSDGKTKLRPQRPLDVDHNHITGKIRGLLCSGCNTAIGHLKDSKTIVASAYRYLELHEDIAIHITDGTKSSSDSAPNFGNAIMPRP